MNGLAILKVAMKSKNRKTGEVVATYRTQDSCPGSCPFLKNGCYAEHGFPSSFDIANKWGESELETMNAIANDAPQGGLVRHHVSGDIMAPDGTVDRPYVDMLRQLADLRPDLMHLMYTHAWREVTPQDFAWPVNASCETEEEVEEALARGYEAVITIPEPSDPLVGKVIGGKKVIICPEETHEGVTCASCKLCARHRKSIVAFVVHGAGQRKARAAIESKR